MKTLKVAIRCTAGLLAVLVMSCSQNTSVGPTQLDRDYFQSVVAGGQGRTAGLATSDVAAFNDGDQFATVAQAPPSVAPQIQSVASDSFVPRRWGVRVTSVSRTVSRVSNQGDSIAIVEAKISFTGTLVILGTLNGAPDTVRKPFTYDLHRLFRFVRVRHTDNPWFNWRLDGVSILNGGTAGAKIAITQMQIVDLFGDTLTVTDPDAYFLHLRHNGWKWHVPFWGFDDVVTLNVTVSSPSADTDLVTVHHELKGLGLHRKPLTLVSQTTGGAGFVRVYTIDLTIPHHDKMWSHLVVSATTRATLYSPDPAQLQSVLWGVPYATVRIDRDADDDDDDDEGIGHD